MSHGPCDVPLVSRLPPGQKIPPMVLQCLGTSFSAQKRHHPSTPGAESAEAPCVSEQVPRLYPQVSMPLQWMQRSMQQKLTV